MTINCFEILRCAVKTTTKFKGCFNAEFLRQRIKVEGKLGKLGEKIKVNNDDRKVVVDANIPFSKRYLKYLTKKYLKKHSLR